MWVSWSRLSGDCDNGIFVKMPCAVVNYLFQSWAVQFHVYSKYFLIGRSLQWVHAIYEWPTKVWGTSAIYGLVGQGWVVIVKMGYLFSPTRRWFYQWKWQCSKSWSHSQNSLCSQISIRRSCACGMLDRGCLLWFTTVYYYVNGKTRRVHSRDVFYWAWITRTWRDAWTLYMTHVLDTSIRARLQTRRLCIPLWLGKYWISRGRNVLLQGNSWRLRFDGLSLRFWQKNKLVRYAHSCVF